MGGGGGSSAEGSWNAAPVSSAPQSTEVAMTVDAAGDWVVSSLNGSGSAFSSLVVPINTTHPTLLACLFTGGA